MTTINSVDTEIVNATISTSTTTPTVISTVNIANTNTVTVQGMINGNNGNGGSPDSTGGTFMATVSGLGGSASLVGTPMIDVNTTSTGTFTVFTSGSTLQIQVTAPSAAAYNWNTTYQIMRT